MTVKVEREDYYDADGWPETVLRATIPVPAEVANDPDFLPTFEALLNQRMAEEEARIIEDMTYELIHGHPPPERR